MIYPRLNRARNGQRLSVELVNGLIKRTEYAADLLRQGKCVAGTNVSVAQRYDGTTISGGVDLGLLERQLLRELIEALYMTVQHLLILFPLTQLALPPVELMVETLLARPTLAGFSGAFFMTAQLLQILCFPAEALQ